MKTGKNRIRMSILSLTLGLIMFIGATFAWFTLSIETSSSLILNVDGEDYEYRFFVYQELDYSGNLAPTLENSICAEPTSQECYLEIVNPDSTHLISNEHTLVPGNRFSFALEITNISGKDLDFSFSFSDLSSTGYLLPANKIQTAFNYSVSKIVYSDSGLETSDVKDTLGIAYAGMAPLANPHFGLMDTSLYELASAIPVAAIGTEKKVIVFFDLYFDPAVSGLDSEGVEVGNSNAFQNQEFIIGKLTIVPTDD